MFHKKKNSQPSPVAKQQRVRKKIKRNPNGKESNKYFTKETQEAINDFFLTSDLKKKESIYNEKIAPAHSKLVENLIRVYSFVGQESFDELKSDCVSFLFEIMQKFDPTRGTNAFSYFNVVAKNWLIVKSRQRAAKIKSCVSIDDTESLAFSEQELIEKHSVINSQDDSSNQREQNNELIKMLESLKESAKNENEKLCIDSILTLFEHANDIDIINKSATFLYIRELSGLSQKQLMIALNAIKKYYRQTKRYVD